MGIFEGVGKKMSVRGVLCVFLLSVCCVSCDKILRGIHGQDSGDFEVYVLEQQWLPRVCCNTPTRHPCPDMEGNYGAEHMVFHLLKPVYDPSRMVKNKHFYWPQYCDAFSRCSRRNPPPGLCQVDLPLADLFQTEQFKDLAPRYTEEQSVHEEWCRHGSCSGLSPEQYFEYGFNLAQTIGTPSMVTEFSGQSVSKKLLSQAFGEKALLVCDDGGLESVRTCWQRNPDNTPGIQVYCPSWMDASCTTGDVFIPKFGQCYWKKQEAPTCSTDAECNKMGWLRCQQDQHCSNIPLRKRRDEL